ncbi:hypothetical protein ACFX13_013590 [Malus domestica]
MFLLMSIWSSYSNWFGVISPFDDIMTFTYPLHKGYCSQIPLLWWGLVGDCLYCLSTTSNKLRSDDIQPSITDIVHSINFQLLEIHSLSKGNMKNYVDELCILRVIGLFDRPAKSPHVIEVLWKPPSLHWVKVNTNGAACGSPGLAYTGGTFRDHFGTGGIFCDVELHVVFHVVNLAWEKGRE